MVDGKRVWVSITDADKRVVEYKAAQWKLDVKKRANPINLTFSAAIDRYIEDKSNILSPSTIRGYRAMQRTNFPQLDNMAIGKINARLIQQQLNENAKTRAAKTIENQFGLISVVLRHFGVDIDREIIAIKEGADYEYNIPEPQELIEIIHKIDGHKYELQFLCSALLGLRPSEVAALEWQYFTDHTIKIRGARVLDENNELVYKRENKSRKGTRTLDVPDYLWDKLYPLRPKGGKGRIFDSKPTTVSNSWRKFTRREGYPDYRLYDLRHSYASLMLSLGVPDKYAMERMGHTTPDMLKKVYQHTYSSKNALISSMLNEWFTEHISG